MNNLSEINALPYVHAVVLFSAQLECIGWSFNEAFQEEPYFEKIIAFHANTKLLSFLFRSFGAAGEIEFIYSKAKILFRKAGDNVLAVTMGKKASTEMVRLASDIFMPQLKKETKAKNAEAFTRDILFKSLPLQLLEEVETLFLKK